MRSLTTALRLLPGTLLIASAISLAGCAAIAKDQQAYNTQQCQAFGLTPGSDAYVQCINMGANAYAASRSNTTNGNNAAPPPAGMAVLPIGIGIPVMPAQPTKNNTCSAPKSSPRGSCPGCSVSCGAQQASCSPGQEFPGGSDICMTGASCQCQ